MKLKMEPTSDPFASAKAERASNIIPSYLKISNSSEVLPMHILIDAQHKKLKKKRKTNLGAFFVSTTKISTLKSEDALRGREVAGEEEEELVNIRRWSRGRNYLINLKT